MQIAIPIFEIKAKYANKELLFKPTVTEIKEMLGRSLTDGIRMICSLPLMADEERFSVYMSTLDDTKDKSEITLLIL